MSRIVKIDVSFNKEILKEAASRLGMSYSETNGTVVIGNCLIFKESGQDIMEATYDIDIHGKAFRQLKSKHNEIYAERKLQFLNVERTEDERFIQFVVKR